MDDSRAQALEDGANMRTGGVNFNYVDVNKLDRLGISEYKTKKPKGNNFMRIVAPDPKGAFAMEIWHHSNVGSSKATYLCLEKMFGKRCPVCEYAQELKRQGADAKTIKDLEPAHRFLLFVVDTTNLDTEEEGAKWFNCPVTIYKEVCTLSKDRRTGAKIDPTDPVDGRDVEFVRVDGKRTSYTGFKLVATKGTIPKSWYENLPSFEDILLIPDPEEMQTAVSGVRPAERDTRDDRRDTRDDRRDTRDDRAERSREPANRREESIDAPDERETQQPDERRSRREPEDNSQATAVRDKLEGIKSRRDARDSGSRE